MLVADLERCPICGSAALGDFIADAAMMAWDDNEDGHMPDLHGPTQASADTSRKLCRECGYVINREG